MLADPRPPILGKIAAPLERALARRASRASADTLASTSVAAGRGWRVSDVLCTAGPADRSFEESHDGISVSIVVAGTFQFRSARGEAMLTPGSLFLGNAGECYECGHEHAAGDRCIAFQFTPAFFDDIVAGVRSRSMAAPFRAPRIPPIRALAPLVMQAAAGAVGAAEPAWDELALDLAAAALRADEDAPPAPAPTPSARGLARVTETVRRIEVAPHADASLATLAADADQSPYHYLRVFRELTGVTPHQFVLRARLRAAAARLLDGDEKVIEVALASGFDDLSNFHRAFREEFGVAPRTYRVRGGR